ncbi:MAG: hypothetical protein GY852_09380 [bacterium]|nr:hypothetical protein [bacterium]
MGVDMVTKKINAPRKGELAIPERNPIAAAVERVKAREDAQHAMRGARAAKQRHMAGIFGDAARGEWSAVLNKVDDNNVNEHGRLGKTLLMVAAEQGEIGAMEQLVRIGAFKQSTDDCDRDAVFYAMNSANEQAAILLVEMGAGWKHGLEAAVREGKYLLAGRFEVFGATAKEIDALREKYPVPKKILSERVRGINDDSAAVTELEQMFTNHGGMVSASSTKTAVAHGEENTGDQKGRRHDPTTDFIC